MTITRKHPHQGADATAISSCPPEIHSVDFSTAAFVDVFARGPIHRPKVIGKIAELKDLFGGLHQRSEASYGIRQFFANGGRRAWVVRAGRRVTASADQLLAGLETLEHSVQVAFSLLCLPATANLSPAAATEVHARALAFAARKHALYLLDAPASAGTVEAMLGWAAAVPSADLTHAAAYFPRLTIPDPLNGELPREVGSSGAVAGIYASKANTYDQWKAPAGSETAVRDAEPTVKLTEADCQRLRAGGLNALRRDRDGASLVIWGARTLLSDGEWQYVHVRRYLNFVAASLEQGLNWTAAEPNDETLWAAIRHSVRDFLVTSWARGAFPDAGISDAFFVRCDRTTTSETDVGNGVVNVVIGLAPLIRTEFEILNIQLPAGKTKRDG